MSQQARSRGRGSGGEEVWRGGGLERQIRRQELLKKNGNFTGTCNEIFCNSQEWKRGKLKEYIKKTMPNES